MFYLCTEQLKTYTMKKENNNTTVRTRAIEMFIGYGDDSGTWGTEYVYIPFDTPEDNIEEAAKNALSNDNTISGYQISGIYSIPNLDDDINTDEEEIYYYEIHVMGKNGFSTCLVTYTEYDTEEDWDKLLNLAIKDNKIDKDDVSFVDYIAELDEEEAKDFLD